MAPSLVRFFEQSLKKKLEDAKTYSDQFKLLRVFHQKLESSSLSNSQVDYIVFEHIRIALMRKDVCYSTRMTRAYLTVNDPLNLGTTVSAGLKLVTAFFNNYPDYALLVCVTGNVLVRARKKKDKDKMDSHSGVVIIWRNDRNGYTVRHYDPNPDNPLHMNPSPASTKTVNLRAKLRGAGNIDIICGKIGNGQCYTFCLKFICEVLDGVDPKTLLSNKFYDVTSKRVLRK